MHASTWMSHTIVPALVRKPTGSSLSHTTNSCLESFDAQRDKLLSSQVRYSQYSPDGSREIWGLLLLLDTNFDEKLASGSLKL